MTKTPDTIEVIHKRMATAANSTDQTLRDKRYLALFHAQEKGETVQLDMIIIGTRGMVLTPANIMPTIKMIVPAWSPTSQSDFFQSDEIEQYWLVARTHETGETDWWKLVPENSFFYALSDPEQWDRLIKRVGELPKRGQDLAGADESLALDLKSWLRQASLRELQALADMRWGRAGLLEETRLSMREHYGPEHADFLAPDPDDSIAVGSEPDQVLDWLSRARPNAFVSVVLVPYLSEYLPAGICIQLDEWLKTAVAMVRPELSVEDVETTTISTLAMELLGEVPDPDEVEGEYNPLQAPENSTRLHTNVVPLFGVCHQINGDQDV